MFNTNLTSVLQAVQSITNSCVLKYPRTILNSPAGDIYVSINTRDLDEDSFEDIAIWTLDEFLNTFKLFTDQRIVSISDKIIHIEEDATKVEYITNSMSLLKEYDKSEAVIDTTKSVPSVAEFVLDDVDLSKIAQASKIFKDLEDVIIKSQDGEITISLSSSNKFNAQANKFSIKKEAQTSKEFTIAVPVENFIKLPTSQYETHVKYNSSKNVYRLVFDSQEIKDFSIVMNVKK